MAANYLHGVEVIEVDSGIRPVQVVKSSVIALVGVAPEGPAEQLTLVLNDRDAAQFGEKIPGFSIPEALDAILKQSPATVVVVNVFDPELNTAEVALEPQTITDGGLKLEFAPIGEVQIFDEDAVTPSLLVKDVDYTLDKFGNFRALTSAASNGTVLMFTYNRFDGGTITAAQIIGTVGTDGSRTGMKLFDLAYPTFGFQPKVLIAPGYSSVEGVAQEMIAAAPKYRAMALIDAEEGKTPTEVIAGRGPAGTLPGFNSSSERAVLCYPGVTVYDPATDSNVVQPYSQYLAGVIAATDLAEGYWVSPSNHEIAGLVGMERVITAGISDATSEANLLNEKGVVTMFSGFGTGIRAWGNRSAAWPTNTAPENFINVRRTADVIHESLEEAMLQFIDRPINRATIDAIRETVNSFMRTLVGRGALIDGECTFDMAKNPETEIANGHLVFDIAFMPPTPAERITFESLIDISMLQALAAVNQQ